MGGCLSCLARSPTPSQTQVKDVGQTSTNTQTSQSIGGASQTASSSGTDEFCRTLRRDLDKVASVTSMQAPRVTLQDPPSNEPTSLRDSLESVNLDPLAPTGARQQPPNSQASLASTPSLPETVIVHQTPDRTHLQQNDSSPSESNSNWYLRSSSPLLGRHEPQEHPSESAGAASSLDDLSRRRRLSSLARESSETRAPSTDRPAPSSPGSSRISEDPPGIWLRKRTRNASSVPASSASTVTADRPPRIELTNGIRNATLPPNEDVPTLVPETDGSEDNTAPELPWDSSRYPKGKIRTMEDILASRRQSATTDDQAHAGPSQPRAQPEPNTDEKLRKKGFMLPTPPGEDETDTEEPEDPGADLAWINVYYRTAGYRTTAQREGQEGPEAGGPETGGPETVGQETGGPETGGPEPSGPETSEHETGEHETGNHETGGHEASGEGKNDKGKGRANDDGPA
ncbi:hypothetical protein EJ05DRAFT_486555 [Pseudovirgaria hyperparasitica]|uniref:Uncharacterized protein n=1 Tax=Pseudovirgaria hyperparasitica TaxID=470096 RepID=A0A6A6W3I8_9PEZI|nr:uncharacterized protein EJ05DRAFT_486555 [Pseudovirgaria hyperparasitica]KAF2757508.1 hypothetical protein EJ05DRAFT_486555 [Pseudovirgaria hyperparasitica]